MNKLADEIEGLLKEYFFAPPVSKGFAKGTCMVCGTPLEDKNWKEQRTQARTAILTLIKSIVPEERSEKLNLTNQSIQIANSVQDEAIGHNACVKEIHKRIGGK